MNGSCWINLSCSVIARDGCDSQSQNVEGCLSCIGLESARRTSVARVVGSESAGF